MSRTEFDLIFIKLNCYIFIRVNICIYIKYFICNIIIRFKTILLKFFLEPVTEIIGGPDLFINKGSTINLTCIVQYAPEPPPTMIWSHNRQIINFDSPRGGISLVTEKGVLTTSRLLIQKAISSDSGVYTCAPSNANPATARVHILNGRC